MIYLRLIYSLIHASDCSKNLFEPIYLKQHDPRKEIHKHQDIKINKMIREKHPFNDKRWNRSS